MESIKNEEKLLDQKLINNFKDKLTPRNSQKIICKEETPVFKEKIINKEVELIVEKPVPRYKEIEVPYDVIVEKPKEKIIEKKVFTEVTVAKPVDKIIEVPI